MPTVTQNTPPTENLTTRVDGRNPPPDHSSASAYAGELLQRDTERASEARFNALIQAGLDSPIDPRSWDEMRDAWTARIEAARNTKAHPSQ